MLQNDKGFTLIEILVSLTLLTSTLFKQPLKGKLKLLILAAINIKNIILPIFSYLSIKKMSLLAYRSHTTLISLTYT
ncbi:hypothetical protein AB986_16825 [Alkalihalobacillus macyae]|uniref:Prepilin-type N-terminal cleavage/methylation domain-containing protein n=1 Tax=Guptibacillus hwajinpoensis TaxID=208199 RepID=A0A0J6CZS6_9BACL|nr:hypothetical protein AB986_16825 [Alkalihalobacillus macyae]